ncbi:MAG TPA: hypothetical protein VK140_15560, partial [Ktedonobacteraceae bacterium]|nr:hypothetical protein [Ktedonobacteraceae bacterium]
PCVRKPCIACTPGPELPRLARLLSAMISTSYFYVISSDYVLILLGMVHMHVTVPHQQQGPALSS